METQVQKLKLNLVKVLCIVNALPPMRNGEGLTASKWVPWGEIMSLGTRNDQSNLINEVT